MKTEEEIIKALKICASLVMRCADCPYNYEEKCATNKQLDAINLIEKQRAEINRLKKYDEERDIRLHARLIANAKAEAIKEFAAKLKANKKRYEGTLAGWTFTMTELDNLVEEMVGDKR